MLSYFTAAVLGLVEGLTEFLPISSTGHLILVNRWFTFGEPFTKLFDVVIQAGAILAVVVLFWKDLWPRRWNVKELSDKWSSILIAFVPTAIVAALFGSLVQEKLFSPLVVAVALIFYGVIFIIAEARPRPDRPDRVERDDRPTRIHSLLVGCAQALALVPGTSRSGVSMLALLLLGYARPAAARFSFLLAVPTLLAASVYSLYKYRDPLAPEQLGWLAVGFLVSFVTAYAVSKWFMAYIQKGTFTLFGWYRIALGFVVLSAMFLS